MKTARQGNRPHAFLDEIVSFFDTFLEAEAPLFGREVGRLRYWQYIRFHYFNQILTGKGWISVSDPRSDLSFPAKLALLLGLTRSAWRNGIHRDRVPTDLLVIGSSNKTVQEGLGPFDPVVDTWVHKIECSSTVWEPPVFLRHLEKKRAPNVFYLDDLHWRVLVRQSFPSAQDAEIDREAGFLVEFARRFDVSLSRSKVVRLIKNAVILQKTCSREIDAVLDRKHPKLIVLVNSYAAVNILITSIAKSKGIYVVELQHGNMGRYHIGYNFGHRGRLDALPDEILTFGQFWNDTSRVSENGVKMTVTGFPYFEKKVREQVVEETDRTRTVILFLSQESQGRQMSEMAARLAKLVDPERYEVWYKLHPREYENWRDRYSQAFQEASIQVFDRVDLYRLLQQADVHVGVYSTTVMEGLAFDKRLILLESYGVHYYQQLIESGRAQLAGTAEEIHRIVAGQDSDEHPRTFDGTYYWAENAGERLLGRVVELLERHA